MSNAPSIIPRFLSAFDVAAALGCSYHAALNTKSALLSAFARTSYKRT